MERKPIRRSPHIMRLSKDHHFSLLFAWKIRQGLKAGVSEARIRKYIKHFWQHHLRAHFREEEDLLFLPASGHKVEKALEDHRRIERQVNAILDASGTKVDEQLSDLSDAVDAHVRYEERELFPYLEKTLSEEELEDIGRKLKKEPALKDDYEDEFWIKKA